MNTLKLRFRLLNSEIGNDQKEVINMKLNEECFRLLNSEIGNDHDIEKDMLIELAWFSSP